MNPLFMMGMYGPHYGALAQQYGAPSMMQGGNPYAQAGQQLYQGGLFGNRGLWGNTGADFGTGGTSPYLGKYDFSGFGGGSFYGSSALGGLVNPLQQQMNPVQMLLSQLLGGGAANMLS